MSPWAWQDHAACRGRGLELFFAPPDGERYDQEGKERREAEAREVCASCPVAAECLDYACDRPEKYGTWGGMTEDEREDERRHRDNERRRLARRAGAAA